MKVMMHPSVHSDLESILEWLNSERPGVVSLFLRQIDKAVARIAVWPRLAPTVELGNDLRVITLSQYPYRIFYRVGPDAVEILHIRHTARIP